MALLIGKFEMDGFIPNISVFPVFTISTMLHDSSFFSVVFLTSNRHNLRNWRRRPMAHFFFYLCATVPQWAKASSLSRIHDHTNLDTTHSVTLISTSDQPKADLKTHNTHKRQTSMLRRSSNPQNRQVSKMALLK